MLNLFFVISFFKRFKRKRRKKINAKKPIETVDLDGGFDVCNARKSIFLVSRPLTVYGDSALDVQQSSLFFFFFFYLFFFFFFLRSRVSDIYGQGVYQGRIGHNSGCARIARIRGAVRLYLPKPRISRPFIRARKGTDDATAAEEKYAEIYREAPANGFTDRRHGRSIMLHFISQIIDDVRARRAAPEALFSASSTYGHLGYTSECYTFCAAYVSSRYVYAHTCSRRVNISLRV